jgi:hypothetical protein
MRSSGVTGLSGVSGGVSIETLLTNTLPDRENQSASFDSRSDDNMSDALPQPDTSGAITRSDIKALRRNLGCLTTNFIPTDRKKPVPPSICGVTMAGP